MIKWAVGITSCHQRLKTTLPATLRSLALAGFANADSCTTRLFADGCHEQTVAVALEETGIVRLEELPTTCRFPKVGVYGNFLQALPITTRYDVPDGGMTDAELPGKCSAPIDRTSRFVPPAYILHVIRSQFASVDILPTWLSTFGHFVSIIVCDGSNEQVVWTYAGWIVTVMKNTQSIRYRSKVQLPRVAMGPIFADTAVGLTVTTNPAAGLENRVDRSLLVNPLPEPVFDSWEAGCSMPLPPLVVHVTETMPIRSSGAAGNGTAANGLNHDVAPPAIPGRNRGRQAGNLLFGCTSLAA
jgi:hypothetical protein